MIYLSSPCSQQQAEHLGGFPVLLSFATWFPFLEQYQPTFRRILIDSGAFSELNSGKKIDLSEYVEWAQRWGDNIDAWAGLDDIAGDWRRSLKNYDAGGFPTYHDTDPEELLPELVQLARERGGWIGIGLQPPRHGKDEWIKKTLRRIPVDLHVHGWACRAYSHHRRFDSFDTTNWMRSAMELRAVKGLHWLTYGECLDIQIKRVMRAPRMIVKDNGESQLDWIDKAREGDDGEK